MVKYSNDLIDATPTVRLGWQVLLATYAIIYECWKRKNFKLPSAMRKSFQFETRSITYVKHNFPHTVTNKAIAETTNLSTLHTDKFW